VNFLRFLLRSLRFPILEGFLVTAPALDLPVPPVRRRLTVRRVPRLEPPYDDELPEGALWLVQREELPFEEPPPRRFEHDIDYFDPQPTPRRNLPDPERWSLRFLQAVVETLAGARPSVQLSEWTSQEVHARIVAHSHPGQAPLPALLQPVVRSVHASEPADGVAEVCAVVQRGHGFFAIAARLEGFDGRWRAVALDLG
jgi:hypothetical protein